MSAKYPGGIITKNYVAPTPSSASGVWTLDQQEQAQQAGIWPFGGPFNYIEDVFSTYLYTGNNATQSISNGIDLSTKGGMVWLKGRTGTQFNNIEDTNRGAGYSIYSNSTLYQEYFAGYGITSFNTNGFTLGLDNYSNANTVPFVSWTFRKQPKFFDVVTYTGDGTTNKVISHNLGSTPGCIITKRTDSTGNWATWHTSFVNTKTYAYLNTTDAAVTAGGADAMTVNSTSFTIGTNQIFGNGSGFTYVAYIFAHNAGGFGLTNTDNVISCGSFTTDGSGNASVNLGYEPQWVMAKRIDSSTGGDWYIEDTMRGIAVATSGNSTKSLSANTSAAELGWNQPNALSATGFSVSSSNYPYGSATYIYIAIRKGPMKVPTDATKVFAPVTFNNATGTDNSTGFPIDLQLLNYRSGTSTNTTTSDRLRGISTTSTASNQRLVTSTTAAEDTSVGALNWGSSGFQTPSAYASISNIAWNFQRAPSFFDEVCDTGTSATHTINHNLGVKPELIIRKARSTAGQDWWVYSAALTATQYLILQTNGPAGTASVLWNDTEPTPSVFTVGNYSGLNNSGITYVTYLFATCPGVSKVGSYTGTGTLTTINCGFAGGARFVLIKRTDSTSNWFVWDTARGMVSGTDPSLSLNTTAAESNANSVYTATTGFQLLASPSADVNTNGGTYIYLAIA